MICFITGQNTYAVAEAVNERLKDYSLNSIERYDGSELTLEQLPNILQGISLFAPERVVVLKEVSANKQIWEALADWLPKIPEEIQVILLETAADKRTKTYKALQKQAEVVLCEPLNEAQAVEWVKGRAKNMMPQAARLFVEYVGTDQWQLQHELEKLLLMNDLSVERIKATIEPMPQASVFVLLDAALAGNVKETRRLLKQCETLEDPYRLFGLLANQIYQLAVVSQAGGKSAEAIAKDIGAHPYPIKKLQSVARRLSKAEVSKAIEAVARLDDQLKRTVAEPWLLIERALLKIATK